VPSSGIADFSVKSEAYEVSGCLIAFRSAFEELHPRAVALLPIALGSLRPLILDARSIISAPFS
jgi:hypothetical protein